MVIRDFNEVLFHNEKWGGKECSERQMASFREALEYCSLTDLGLRMNQFTWSNKHEDATFIKERLDRAVGNIGWTQSFLEWKVDSIVIVCLDPKLIVLSCNQKITSERRKEKLFRFEA